MCIFRTELTQSRARVIINAVYRFKIYKPQYFNVYFVFSQKTVFRANSLKIK